jgi:hypothetical protein
MKYFLEMIEVANNNGVQTPAHLKDKKAFEHFQKIVNEAEVFVFSPTEDPQCELEESLGDREVNPDAPFRVFSIELSGDTPLTSSSPVDLAEFDADVRIWCIVGYEVAPRDFLYFSLVEVEHKNGPRGVKVMSGKQFNDTADKIATIYFDRLGKEKFGRESVRERVKVGTGKGKKFLKINSVIHVTPKKYTGNVTSIRGREIDWSHRWTVRGHWRKVKGVGKDRLGNYVVNGFTWIESFTKGPDDMPLVKKQRLVENEVIAHN